MASQVEIIIKGVDKASKVFKDVGNAANKSTSGIDKMKSMLGTLAVSAAGVAAALAVAKKAFDFAKEGAQLEFMVGKFDRLSDSIGTTSEALLNDLKVATRGTVSEMDAMAGAVDFIALGLAKTHDEAVRLTSVASALGMNMNQLVLTLTNKTTMRFDAIGVSVDGFKEKVKALEDAGLSADEAFKEAFLQQAEAQIKKVGHVADTSAGDIMKMEASLQDLKNSFSSAAAESALFRGSIEKTTETVKTLQILQSGDEQIIKAANKEIRAAIHDSSNYVEYLERINEIYAELEKIDFMGNLADQFEHLSEGQWGAIRDATLVDEKMFILGKTVIDTTEAIDASGEEIKEETGRLKAWETHARDAASANENLGESFQSISTGMGGALGTMQTQIELMKAGMGEVQAAYAQFLIDAPAMQLPELEQAADVLSIQTVDVELKAGTIDAEAAAEQIAEQLGIGIESAMELVKLFWKMSTRFLVLPRLLC